MIPLPYNLVWHNRRGLHSWAIPISGVTETLADRWPCSFAVRRASPLIEYGMEAWNLADILNDVLRLRELPGRIVPELSRPLTDEELQELQAGI